MGLQVAEPAALPPLRQPEKEPEAKAGTPPNSYTVEANSLVFTKPAKVTPVVLFIHHLENFDRRV